MTDGPGESPAQSGPVVARLDRAIQELRHASFGYFGPARRVNLLEATGWEWSPAHYRLLRAVEATDPLRPTVSELAGALLSDKARASRLVSDLQRSGLVERRQGRLDRRRREIELTAEGTAVLAEAKRFRLHFLAECVGGWDDDDVAQLVGLLDRFNDEVRDR